MSENIPFHDALGRLAQAGATREVQLVRITELDEANRYTARPVEFAEDGSTEFVGTETLTVINLAEPADATGRVHSETDAVAIDVEGRWVVFLDLPGAAIFPVKVVSSQGSAAYTVREQVPTGGGTFADKEGAANITAYNLAELSLGPGAAVDDDTILLVTALADEATPPTVRYYFNHPAYAKYLD